MRTYIFCLLTFLPGHSLLAQQIVKALDPLLENYEYPFPVRFISLDIQQERYRMAYMDVLPQKPNGKSIVLFHGKNFSGAYWKTTAQALSEAGYYQ